MSRDKEQWIDQFLSFFILCFLALGSVIFRHSRTAKKQKKKIEIDIKKVRKKIKHNNRKITIEILKPSRLKKTLYRPED